MSDTKNIQAFNPATVALQNSNLIEASAGTGKTYSIAILTLRLVLEKQIPIQQILMVTFTKAAVAELETRIRQFMRNALKAAQGLAIGDETIIKIVEAAMQNNSLGKTETERLLKEAVLFLDETAILTIHSFCQRVLTEFAFETRQVFGAEILTDAKAVLTDKVNAFWRKYITTLKTGLLKELIAVKLDREKLLDVLMNAMAGKTMLPLQPVPLNFLSPANQSALCEALGAMNTEIETIKTNLVQYIVSNETAIRIATEKNAHTKRNLLHLLNRPDALLAAIIDTKEKVYVQKTYLEILTKYEQIEKIEMEKEVEVRRLLSHVFKLAIEVITAEMEQYKQQNNQLGFDDMITKLHQAVVVDNNPGLISSLQEKYKAAFIDEFQDTDKMQYEIFDRLFAARSVLFYIGDPKQSIYAWRKADIFTYFKAGQEVTNRFGMDTNYRSSKRFIEAMNFFFVPAPGFDTFHFAGEQHQFGYLPVEAPPGSLKDELHHGQNPETPITIFENPNNESISETVVAQIIQLLSDSSYTIPGNGKPRNIRPSDIGILVRKNKQAAAIKKLLSKYCIPAVTIDDTKLLQSDEARLVLYILSAVLDITASGINKALLSPLTGFNAAAILAMDDELAVSRFKNYQYLWEQEGVYVMLSKFLADYKVKRVLLNNATENGERIITNILQLMEVLHKLQTQKQFSMQELASWLKRGIEGMEVEGDEFEQRVESDEESVKIVTIHKSKGLEYNIVFAPFLDLNASTDFELVTFRDASTGDYLFAAHALLNEEQLRITEKQLEQENRRLIYVAITRAVYKCYINRNTYNKFSQSALAPFINAIKETKPPLIAFETAPAIPQSYRYTSGTAQLEPAYLQAANFHLAEINWRKLSYTYLDPGHTPIFKPGTGKALAEYDEFIFRQLKRGANTGNLVHYIFERIDFTDAAYWPKIIADALKRFMPNAPATYALQLTAMLQQVTAVNISPMQPAFCLADLQKDQRITELEFDFNVAPFSPDAVNNLSTAEVNFQVRNARELEGIMNGKIDMFFEHAGKYFILDWKSNFLGDQPSSYSKQNIHAAMTESNYHLQYLVYTLAVKKYLQLRLPGFNYATHFGGVIYLFIRGVRKGASQGIFTFIPPESLINELDKLLSKEAMVS